MKRLLLVSLLMLSLAVTVGCAKKQTESAPTDTSMSSAEAMLSEAAQTITDGVIYFDFNKYDIKEEYRQMLQQKADLMRQYPNIRVRIEGNCDARGTQEYNLALGERRARAAYEYLVLLGVNPSQLEIISYGKERPVVMGDSEAAYAANRRDNFRVIAQ